VEISSSAYTLLLHATEICTVAFSRGKNRSCPKCAPPFVCGSVYVALIWSSHWAGQNNRLYISPCARRQQQQRFWRIAILPGALIPVVCVCAPLSVYTFAKTHNPDSQRSFPENAFSGFDPLRKCCPEGMINNAPSSEIKTVVRCNTIPHFSFKWEWSDSISPIKLHESYSAMYQRHYIFGQKLLVGVEIYETKIN